MKERVTERIAHAVLRLGAEQAENIVAAFELDGGKDITPNDVHLLERYFLEHPEEEALGGRYEEALRKHAEARGS